MKNKLGCLNDLNVGVGTLVVLLGVCAAWIIALVWSMLILVWAFIPAELQIPAFIVFVALLSRR